MRLVLFRHAPAEARDAQRWPEDLARPLTSRGRSRARRAARTIRRLEPRLARVLASPAERAMQTAAVLSEELKTPVAAETLPSLAPGGSWRETLRALAQEPADLVVALVGHEPDLGKLAGVLLFGAPTALSLKKAGACSIDAAEPVAGGGRLRWLLAPAAMRTLSRRSRA